MLPYEDVVVCETIGVQMKSLLTKSDSSAALLALSTTTALLALFPYPCAGQETPPVVAHEAEPLVTDRPDFTESARLIPVRRSQIEAGYTSGRDGNQRSQALGEFLLRVGMARSTEFRLGLSSWTRAHSPEGTTNGWEGASLGVKLRLADGAETAGQMARPAMALIVSAIVPSGSPVYRENRLQPEAKLCFAWDLSERLQMSSNLNYGRPVESGVQFGQVGGTLSFGYALTKRVAAYTEYFGFFPEAKGSGNAHFLNGGFTYLVTADYQLDIRAGAGLNHNKPASFFGFGFARRF